MRDLLKPSEKPHLQNQQQLNVTPFFKLQSPTALLYRFLKGTNRG